MRTKTPIGVALIGYGYWGARLFRSLSTLSGVRIETVCTRRTARVPESPATAVVKTYQDAIQNNRVHAVVVATPPSTHYAISSYALRYGKHVLVEKPMTITAGHATKLITLANQKRLTLLVDHTYLYARPIQKIRELIANGTLGKILFIESSRANLGRFSSDSDVLWDLAPHDVSICDYLFGQRPQDVSVFAGAHVTQSLLDKANLWLHYPGGTDAYIHFSWLSPIKERRLVIVGSKKMLVYDDVNAREEIRIYDRRVILSRGTKDKHPTFSYEDKGISTVRVPHEEPLRLACTDFIESIKTGKPPLVGGEDGKTVVQILEAIHVSRRNGGKKIRVTYDSTR